MRLISYFRRPQSARTAQHRLQVLLKHERSAGGTADLILLLHEDILAAIGKHMTVDPEKVKVRVERGNVVSLLEIDIEIPTLMRRLVEGRATSFYLG